MIRIFNSFNEDKNDFVITEIYLFVIVIKNARN
jgi:hypothetical protein